MNDNHNKKCERCGEGTYKIADLNDEIHGELHCNKCGHFIKRLTNERTTEMEDTIKELTVTKSLKLLRDGFKSDFATSAYADMRMNLLLHELVAEFVDANIPVVDEENRIELGMMLLETLDIVAR